jgi:hypothetical protein
LFLLSKRILVVLASFFAFLRKTMLFYGLLMLFFGFFLRKQYCFCLLMLFFLFVFLSELFISFISAI